MLKLPGTPSREERFYLSRSPQRRLGSRAQSRRMGPTLRALFRDNELSLEL